MIIKIDKSLMIPGIRAIGYHGTVDPEFKGVALREAVLVDHLGNRAMLDRGNKTEDGFDVTFRTTQYHFTWFDKNNFTVQPPTQAYYGYVYKISPEGVKYEHI